MRIVRYLLMLVMLLALFNCGEDRLHLFKLKGDIRKGWVRTLGGVGNEYITKIIVDDNDCVYIFGTFSGMVDFDPGNAQVNLMATFSDIFFLKLNKWGEFCWVKIFNGIDMDDSTDLSVGKDGNFYLVGKFYETLDFDPGPGVQNRTSLGESDAFILKLNNQGDYCWVRILNGSSIEQIKSIHVDSDGNCYTTGTFQETVDFDPGEDVENRAANDISFFILKLNSEGEFVWVRTIINGGFVIGNCIKSDADGFIYVLGNFEDSVDFDTSSAIETRVSKGMTDVFLLKLDRFANFCWVKTFGGVGVDSGIELQLDDRGMSYLVGAFEGTVDFDSGNGVQNRTANGDNDVFVLKLKSSNGEYLWVNTFGGINSDQGRGIGFDDNGNYYVSGHFSGIVDFDPSSRVAKIYSAGQQDGFVVKFGSDDSFCWAKRFGGSGEDWVKTVTVNTKGYCYLTGTFSGTVDFGTSGIPDIRTSLGTTDTFIMKLPRQ